MAGTVATAYVEHGRDGLGFRTQPRQLEHTLEVCRPTFFMGHMDLLHRDELPGKVTLRLELPLCVLEDHR